MNYYEINKDTICLVPIDLNKTKVYELDDEFIVYTPIFNIIKDSCLSFGSSYIGRHDGTKSILGVSHKAPIIIEESNEIIFFPTTSPRLKVCCWISLKHIKNYIKKDKETLVNFDNKKSIILPVSSSSFDNQYLHSMMLLMSLKKSKEKMK